MIGLEGLAPVQRATGSSARAANLRRAPAAVAAVAAVAVVLMVAALGSLVVACGSTTPGGLVVPVLWAADSDGVLAGGVEPARVSVVDGDGGFEVDLTTEQAQGAGPQWVAASGSAAMVGTLASAADPRAVNIRFDISGPIDGPSGGAALTVGVLAAIRGLDLRDGVTMTGTISPDGSVGRVGLVPTKVRAASDAGFTLVLIPRANAADRDPDTGLDVVALGESLGIEVRPVADLGAAVAAFTGGPITTGDPASPALSPAVATVTGGITAAMVERLEADLAGAGALGASASAVALATEQVALARAARDAGDLAGAYGASANGVLGLARAAASGAATAAAAAGGVASVGTTLAAEAADVKAAADAALGQWDTAGSLASGAQTSIAQLTVPAAMGWLTYARAAAEASGAAVATAISPSELGGLAGTIAEQRVAVEVMWPDALAVVVATNDGPGQLVGDVDNFLDGYTALLTSASEANEQYLDAVLASGGVTLPATDPAVLAAGVLGDITADGASAVVRASAAMSWWFVTSAAVSGRQAFGLDSFGLGGDVGIPASQATLDAAVRNAVDTVLAAAGTLAERGVDPSAALWSASWGQAAAVADAGTQSAAGEVVALGEVWYSAITVFVLLAASEPAA